MLLDKIIETMDISIEISNEKIYEEQMELIKIYLGQ